MGMVTRRAPRFPRPESAGCLRESMARLDLALRTVAIYDDVFAALHAARVRYVVVGGMAVVLQGHPRMTVDLDLVVDLAADKAGIAVAALTNLGLQPRLPVAAADFADADKRRAWVEQRNLQVFSFYDPQSPMREVDVFATEPLPLDQLLAEASVLTLGGVPVAVASRRHLIAMKRQAGRPQDLADIAALEELEKDRG